MPRSRCSTCGYPDFSDVEEYIPEPIEQTFKKEYLDSKNRSQQEASRFRTPHLNAEILKKSAAIAKTIQDPSGQLSKRRRKKLSALGEDRMNNDVVYSMNKQKRWQVDPDELLMANQNLGIDVIVIEKVHSRPESTASYKKVYRHRSKRVEEENDADYEEFSDSEDEIDSEEDFEEERGFKLADYMAAQKFNFFKKTQGSQRRITNTRR